MRRSPDKGGFCVAIADNGSGSRRPPPPVPAATPRFPPAPARAITPPMTSPFRTHMDAALAEARAAAARAAARAELSPAMRAQAAMLEAMRDAAPGAVFVGDSTQPVYAGNLVHDHDRPGGWFNAATGYGALGYAIPAAIGAALADPSARVLCLAGDGGAQFTLPELMTASDERLPITFVIWNNRGYREIEGAMIAAGVAPIGCGPTPPDFSLIAAACGIPHRVCAMAPEAAAAAVRAAGAARGPSMIEIDAAPDAPA